MAGANLDGSVHGLLRQRPGEQRDAARLVPGRADPERRRRQDDDFVGPARALRTGRGLERSSVMARERYGNGYLGRGGTRRRMKSRNRGYVGSARTAGRAKGRMAPDLIVGKVWK